MAGLLDQFINLSPEQSQGLLAAAAQMLQMSGPSLRPISTGQIFGSGLSAYQGGLDAATKRKIEDEQAKQTALLNNVKLQEAQGGLQDRATSRADAERLRQFYLNRQSPASQPQLGGDQQQQPQQALPQPLSATPQQSTPGMSSMLPQAPQQAAQGQQSPYEQRMAESQALRAQGFHAQADAAEAAALKFKPEFDQTPRVGVGSDGKPFTYVMDKDGNPKVVKGVLPRDEMKLADLGGSQVAYNPYALTTNQSFSKSASPDALMTDARARDFNATKVEANNIARGEKKATADMTKASQVASFDTMLGTLSRLADHPGLKRSVGLYSALPTTPGSDSANFQAELNTFQSQAFIPMVAQLKGMGALSDAEGKKLTQAVGALDPKMGEPAFRASIGRITSEMEAARQRVSGGKSVSSAQNIPTGAANMLKMNPSLRAQFDEKYGDGAADKVLGK